MCTCFFFFFFFLTSILLCNPFFLLRSTIIHWICYIGIICHECSVYTLVIFTLFFLFPTCVHIAHWTTHLVCTFFFFERKEESSFFFLVLFFSFWFFFLVRFLRDGSDARYIEKRKDLFFYILQLTTLRHEVHIYVLKSFTLGYHRLMNVLGYYTSCIRIIKVMHYKTCNFFLNYPI